MDFDETIKVLKGIPGYPADVSVHRRGLEHDGSGGIAHFSGTIDRVTETKEPSGGWRVWFREVDAPMPNGFVIDPAIFDGADVQADSGLSLEEVIEESAHERGTTWTIWVRQAGIVLEIMLYV